jgi:hypothetical protein
MDGMKWIDYFSQPTLFSSVLTLGRLLDVNVGVEQRLSRNLSYKTSFIFSTASPTITECNAALRLYADPARFRPCGHYISLGGRFREIIGPAAHFQAGKKVYLNSDGLHIASCAGDSCTSHNVFLDASFGVEWIFQKQSPQPTFGMSMGIEI